MFKKLKDKLVSGVKDKIESNPQIADAIKGAVGGNMEIINTIKDRITTEVGLHLGGGSASVEFIGAANKLDPMMNLPREAFTFKDVITAKVKLDKELGTLVGKGKGVPAQISIDGKDLGFVAAHYHVNDSNKDIKEFDFQLLPEVSSLEIENVPESERHLHYKFLRKISEMPEANHKILVKVMFMREVGERTSFVEAQSYITLDCSGEYANDLKQWLVDYDEKVRRTEIDHLVVEDMGITSETHASHLNGIVYSNSDIKRGNETPDQLINCYSLGDELVLRMYYQQSIYKSFLNDVEHGLSMRDHNMGEEIRYYFDGKLIRSVEGRIPEEQMKTWTTLSFTLLHPTKDDLFYMGHIRDFFVENQSLLTPGKHRLDVEYYMYDLKTDTQYALQSKGGVDIDITDNGIKKLFSNPIYQLPKPYKNDPELEQRILQAISIGGSQTADSIVSDYYHVIITSDWSMSRKPLTGTLIGRSVWAAGIYKQDDKVVRLRFFRLFQNHDGNDFSGDLRVVDAPYSEIYPMMSAP